LRVLEPSETDEYEDGIADEDVCWCCNKGVVVEEDMIMRVSNSTVAVFIYL
jgi:hypothetical protein